MNYENILDKLTKLMIEVGEYQVDKFHTRNFLTETKSTDIDMVTEVDKKSEKMLIEGLKTHYPDFGVLAEESGSSDIESDHTWVIDPLDGTTNFSTGIPVFAISVALEYKNEVILGAVYAPLQKAMYTAVKGNGANKNGHSITVNEAKNLRSSVIATGFPYDRADNPVNNVDEISNVAPKVKGIRRLGAAAYDLCLVAEGVFAGYWEYGLQPWDYSAGLLIAKEAGAVDAPLTKRENSMIVCNPHILEELKDTLM